MTRVAVIRLGGAEGISYMRIVAHRGNLQGKSAVENDPRLIREALDEGFDVEVDLWTVNGQHFFGHDGPAYKADLSSFDVPGVFFHLKSPHLPRLVHADAFAIDHDNYVLTLRGALWTNYGQPADGFAIICAPELVGNPEPLEAFVARNREAMGICTDFPRRVRQLLEQG